MNTTDLMLKIAEALDKEGFEVKALGVHFFNQIRAEKDGKAWRTPVEGYDFTHLNGFTVNISEVHRSNATAENVSVDIAIIEWERSSGHTIAKERVNIHQSEKQIQNRIKKIVDQYNAIEIK